MNIRKGLNVDKMESYPTIDNRDPSETWIWLDNETQLVIMRYELFRLETDLELNKLNLTSEDLEQSFQENNEAYEEELRERTTEFLSNYDETDYLIIQRIVNEIVKARID